MTSPLLPADFVVVAYVDLRLRVVELLRATPEVHGDLIVPACPEWSVRELVGHVVGVPEDIITGNMEGVTTPAWTAEQVARHAGKSLLELADSLEMTGFVFDDVITMIREPVNSQFVMDAVTHELDLREALGDEDARDSAAVTVAVGWLRFAFAAALPADTFEALDTNRITPHELLRSLTGRRTPTQMDALGLDGAAVSAALAGTPLAPPV